MDRGAWWATVHGVTQSWTRLKRLITQRIMRPGAFLFLILQLTLVWGTEHLPKSSSQLEIYLK